MNNEMKEQRMKKSALRESPHEDLLLNRMNTDSRAEEGNDAAAMQKFRATREFKDSALAEVMAEKNAVKHIEDTHNLVHFGKKLPYEP